MYEYKFVVVEIKSTFWNGIQLKSDYVEIIHEHAKQGWRFVQIFAPAIKGYGSAAYYELIFEKPKEV